MQTTKCIPPPTALIPDELPFELVVEEPVDDDVAPDAVPDAEEEDVLGFLEVEKVTAGSAEMALHEPPIQKEWRMSSFF